MFFKTLKIVLLKLLERAAYLIIGWGLIIPLTCLIPKKKNLVLFKGSSNNVKYLFFYACQQDKEQETEVYYLTRNKNVIRQFAEHDLPVIKYPSLAALWKMLRAGSYIIDNHISALNYYIFYRSNKIQLWHGIPLKQIGPSSIKGLKKLPPSLLKEIGQKIAFYPKYDIFMSTSDYYTNEIFASTIKTKHYVDYGYPRNDMLFHPVPVDNDLLGTDTANNQIIRHFKELGGQVVLFAPTFRDTGGDPISDKAIELNRLNAFGEKHNLLFVFKFHPTTPAHSLIKGLSHCLEYNKSKDIYPVMNLIDLMVTDYSSIYLDYLLLKRPVLFFPYDYKKYTEKDRDIQVDYNWITPGPKCSTQEELEQEITAMLINKEDKYQEKRREILNIAFKYQDGEASRRIWDVIKAHNQIA
ncbi:CDP-glycerol glycerophosphotransferase family protein [Sporomusa acidovorans]|uniref:Teichoic acid glycerol-phosphate transferase n=1 Tax=Sporomusa acidovorans (strain ATCC 49682 / DSM 3132 / Mol) TaxID=1123286 RepID=A0ABZ3J8D5_SPOA4|nr:CDP-glycerol glycerophosphotransferase family protein [Sporomusa acidovorans]OZC19323.1 CDP-glycerol:poly(glycerophosphate) glycerophosphotransferase [Sporomusa acidovorans DSM 3132]SDD80810.1 CDP-glycerol glycerophosphotransferase, TagB/SpsB family [Sporomusa acidovorans]